MSPDYHATHWKQFFETQDIEITGHKTPFMSDRLKPFSTEELTSVWSINSDPPIPFCY